nr:Pol polyprotein [Tanacetum cinerariifolium]
MLPKRNQTIFDAPLGNVGLYTHYFTHSNLSIPLPKFFCEVLNYFKVHISHFNPFGLAKLTTFTVMCKAYGSEPSVELLRAFLNLGPAGNWLTLSNRELDFRSFMMKGIDGKFHFLLREDIPLADGFPPVPLIRNPRSSLYFFRMTNTQTSPPATIVVNTMGAPATNTVANHREIPEKFNGQNFKRRQQNMFFYLTTLGLARFLKETIPQVEPPIEGQSSNAQAVQAVEAWKHSNFLCHNYVLNGLIDPLYNVYCKTTTAKELWESLERKYKTEDASTKKFVGARFLDYKMVDSKNVISQVQDLQVLIHDIHAEGMTLSETFQVAAIIEKLPSSWSNPKGKGKDKRKNEKKSIEKFEYLAPKARIVKQKFQGTCYNCDQPGHRAANCKMPKRVNPRHVNMVNDDVDMIEMVFDLCVMISEMTSEKELKLTNVLYVLEIRKNLVSGWLLNKFGFRLVFESVKFVLSKNQIYVGKGYAMNVIFKLNVMVVKNEINKMNSSAYLIESSNVWHGRLGHVNFNSMRRLIKFISIPNFHIDSKYKCETCVEAKLTRTSFKSVKQKTKPLDMVHTDICDLKSLPIKDGNKYFIMFIDDCTKYCYVYLLKSKDEVIDKFILYKTKVKNQLGHVGESILTAMYLLNKIPRKEKEETPYELWMGRKPSYQYLRVWGCLAKVVVSNPKAQKIGPKSVDCIFIGYTKNNSAYRFIVHESKNLNIQKNTVMESKNASFFEHIFPCLSKENGSSSRLDDEVVQDKRQQDDNDLQDERQDQNEEEEVEPRKSKRARNEKSFRPDFVSFMMENKPTSYREAITSSNGYKWIFKKKMKADGTIDKYKARLVIKGFRQREVAIMDCTYDKYPAVIEGYSDANWISDIKDSLSTSGYVFTLGGTVISWKSSKQTVIAKSTMESEFIALDKGGEEAEWLRQFVEDIPRCPKLATIISIHCDRQSAIGRAQSTMYNGKSRHIRHRHSLIRQLLSIGVISIDYVASKDHITDPFMKGLSKELETKYISQGKLQRVTPTYPMQDLTAEILPKFSGVFDRSPFMWGIVGKMIGALRSPRRELRNELKYVQGEVKMNEISCLKVGHCKRNCPAYLAELIKKKKQVGIASKMTRKTFSHRLERATDLLGIIHTDVCGLLRHVSRQDRGGEYISQEFKDYLKSCGIIQQLTPPYTSQHNDVSERRNRTLLDVVRSMMNLTTLPLSFWDYALESVTRILNMVSTKKVDKTPYELWYGKVSNLPYLKVWECKALVKRDTHDILQQRSVKCIFIGYPKETMGYYFYFQPENKIVVARYAEFFEKNLITQEVSGRAIDLEEIQDEDTSPSEITSKIPVEVKGFEPPQEEVISILRSIYGLKQASRSWNKRFNEEIKRFGFTQNLDEPCVYQKASGINVTFLILYVDDIIIMGNHIPSLQSVKDYLGKCFAMKDLGEAAFILGIKIYRDRVWYSTNNKRTYEDVCDNSVALLIANEPRVQKGARHYYRRCHYVRECIELSEINLLKVYTDDNLADPFMKALPKGKLTQHARSTRLRLASSFM